MVVRLTAKVRQIAHRTIPNNDVRMILFQSLEEIYIKLGKCLYPRILNTMSAAVILKVVNINGAKSWTTNLEKYQPPQKKSHDKII